MDLLNFLIRAIAFMATIWVLLEFIYVCNVKTSTGLLIILLLTITVVLIFFSLRTKNITVCDKCKRPQFKK